MENTKELEDVIRSLLVSNPKVTKANSLFRDYDETEEKCFPFRELGFHSFVDYLRSIPHVVRLEPSNSYNPDVLPVMTKDSSHIDQMVSKQRTTVPKRRKTFSQRGGYNGFGRGGPLPPRRRTAVHTHTPQPRFMPTNYKGVHESEIERHIRGKYSNEHLSSNGIHSGQDLLYHAREMVDRVDQKVYPKLSYSSEIPTATKQQPEGQSLGVPAGMEDEYEDEYEDGEYFEDDDDPDAIRYDEQGFDKNDEEALSAYTIQLCTEKLLSSKTNDQPATKRVEEDSYAFEEELTSEDHESTFSRAMIDNFRAILAKYPEGLWATQLQQKYMDQFKLSLNYMDLGYASAINMVSCLPNVFTYEREGHDWKLFDACLVGKGRTRPDDKTAIWADKYVPDIIYKNVINLVQKNPDGIKSSYFLSYYENEYYNKLNVEELGFKQLEEFLEYFKDKITITKSVGHYLLLPKHTTRSLDNPPTPNEELKLPPNIEFLGPDNVLKPDDIIPMQKLPALEVNAKNTSEPLMIMEVRVAEVTNPGYFFLMLDSNFNALESLMEDLDKFYKQEERHYHIFLLYLKENLFCACKYENEWHRAKIIRVLPSNKVEIEYVDYGTPGKVNQSELRFLHSDFAKLPTQAICAKLLGITPVGGGTKWPRETCTEFLRLVTGRRLFANVYHIGTRTRKEERLQVSVVLHDTFSDPRNEIICNEYLVEKGFAEFVNKEPQGILEESPHTLTLNLDQDQATSSAAATASSPNPPPAQAAEPKPTSSILPPPGFESLPSAAGQSQDGQHHPQHTTFEQHYHHTNNFLFPPPTNNLQQYLLQNPNILNTQQINYQQPHFNDNWSNMPYLQNYPNYFLPNNIPQGYLQPTNMYFHPPQAPQSYYPSQAYNPLNINVNLRNFPNYNTSVRTGNTLARMPGYSGDLTAPLRAVSRTQPPPTVSDLQYQLQTIANSLPPPKPLNTESSAKLKLECDEPLPVELKHECDELLPVMLNLECNELSPPELNDECVESTDQHRLGLPNLIETVQRETDFELDNLDEKISNENVLQSQMVYNQSLTNSSASDKYLSDEDLIECHSVENEKVTPLVEIQSSLVNETKNKIPESWEDIDADDTPAKSENFSEDFTNLLVLKSIEVSPVEPNDKSSNSFISETNRMNCDNKLLTTKSIENTLNWKDHFNPDSKNNIESNKTAIKTTPRIEDNNFKRKLVERIDFKDKFFHIIYVKSKYAVLAKEFYIQFVQIKFNVIEKVVPRNTNKEFPKIYRKDHQELFSELDKITPYGESVERVSGRIGYKTTSIPYSYLSDIPVVLSALNVKIDTHLSKIIEEWELRATTT